MNSDNKYNFLKKKKYYSKNYSLLPIRKKDIQVIRRWRNEQINVLRQSLKISEKQQLKYYNNVIKKSFREKKPELILFSFLLNNKCIGYGGFVHIDWHSKRAEISFITETKRNNDEKIYSKDFLTFFNLIFEIGFKELIFNKLVTETFDIRPYVIKLLESINFKLEGRLKKHVYIDHMFVDSLIHGCFKKNKP